MSQPQRSSQLFNWMPHSLRPRRLRAEYLLRRGILYAVLTLSWWPVMLCWSAD